MRKLVSFFALSLCAAAQTTQVPTVTLSGPVADPVIVNHSGKQIIAAMVVLTEANGVPWVHQRLFTHDSLGLPDGASERFGTFSKNQKLKTPIVSSNIAAVIFADGEFRGVDSYQAGGATIPADFQSNMERHIQSMRQAWQMAKDGNWDGLKAKAAGSLAHDSFGVVTAMRLLDAHDNGKDAAGSFAHFGLLPANTWKSGLAFKLKFVPDFLQALVEWIMPTAHAASFCCVGPYSQGTGTDGNHPTQYTYYCNSNDDSIACPPLRGYTPNEGMIATCGTDAGPYYIADQVSISTDDAGFPREQTGASVKDSGYTTIENGGFCRTQPFLLKIDNWEFDKQCTGVNDPAPKTITDTTGDECGATALGYCGPSGC